MLYGNLKLFECVWKRERGLGYLSVNELRVRYGDSSDKSFEASLTISRK